MLELMAASIWASVGWGVVTRKCGGGHDLAGLAVAALGDVDLLPCNLNGVGAVEGEAFDGGDGIGADVIEERLAGAGGLAGDEDGAGTAVTDAAAIFGALEVEDVAENPEEGRVWSDVYGVNRVVDF